jgi:hypothetical protein
MGSRTLGSGNNGQCGLVVQVGRDGTGLGRGDCQIFYSILIQPRITQCLDFKILEPKTLTASQICIYFWLVKLTK